MVNRTLQKSLKLSQFLINLIQYKLSQKYIYCIFIPFKSILYFNRKETHIISKHSANTVNHHIILHKLTKNLNHCAWCHKDRKCLVRGNTQLQRTRPFIRSFFCIFKQLSQEYCNFESVFIPLKILRNGRAWKGPVKCVRFVYWIPISPSWIFGCTMDSSR